MRLFLICMVVLGLCMVASAAPDAGVVTGPAVTAPAQTPHAVLTDIIDAVIKIVVGVLGALAIWAVHKGTEWISAKMKIDVPAGVEDQVNVWAREGIAFAEEQARKLADKAPTGSDKLEMAVGYVWGLAQQHGLVDYARDKIQSKIEALLNMQRAPAPPALPRA